MKKTILALCLGAAIAIGSVSAEDGFHIKPMAALDLGLGNYFRGVSGGGQVSFGLGGFWIGIEPKVEYDAAYSIAAIPVTLDLGIGDNFWLMAGTTLGPNPSISGNALVIPMQYSGFLNTFGLGLNWLNFSVSIAKLSLFTELTYTLTQAVNSADVVSNAIGSLASTFLGLKAYVGVGLQF